MWLINVRSLLNDPSTKLKQFFGSDTPPFAILSHRWQEEEVLFDDIQCGKPGVARSKKGWSKLEGCCAQALKDGFEWVWADQCCINKNNGEELQASINSMYAWYAKSQVCYAYLADVKRRMVPMTISSHSNRLCKDELTASMWFRRGWTLQELIAPGNVEFYNQNWEEIGTKHSLSTDIAKLTGIPVDALLGGEAVLKRISAACKLSWAARRETTKEEDMAYCLIGIFDIHLELLYGEGAKAFQRLQEEVMRQTEDHTLLLGMTDWAPDGSPSPDLAEGALATKPMLFRTPHLVQRFRPNRKEELDWGDIWCDFDSVKSSNPATLTSRGLHTTLYTKFNPKLHWNDGDAMSAWTNCIYQKGHGNGSATKDEPKFLICFQLWPYRDPQVTSQGVISYPNHNIWAQPRWTPVKDGSKKLELLPLGDKDTFQQHDLLLASWVQSFPKMYPYNRKEPWKLIIQLPDLYPDGRKGPSCRFFSYSDRLVQCDSKRHGAPRKSTEMIFTDGLGHGPREWAESSTLATNTSMPLMTFCLTFPSEIPGRSSEYHWCNTFVTVFISNILRESICCGSAFVLGVTKPSKEQMKREFDSSKEPMGAYQYTLLQDRNAIRMTHTTYLSFTCKQFNATTNVLRINFEECLEEEAEDFEEDFS